jgi:hypothetical protein
MNHDESDYRRIMLLTVGLIIAGFIIIGLTLSLFQAKHMISNLRVVNSNFNNQDVIIDRLKTKINKLEEAVVDPKDNENYVSAKRFYDMESSLKQTISKYDAECQVRDRLMKAAVKLLNGD